MTWSAERIKEHAAKVAAITEASMSLDARRQAVQDAVQAWAKPASPPSVGYAWCRDVYDDYVVFSADGGAFYKVGYKIGADGVAELKGEPKKVTAVTSYEPVAEAAPPAAGERELVEAAIPLVERALAKDGATTIKLIQAGWGSSGYYSPEVLKRDGPKAFAKGTHMYWDHPTRTDEKERPERSVKDLAAVLTGDSAWNEKGSAGPGLYAPAQVVATYKDSLEALAPHIGVSIRALGRAEKGEAEGRQGDIISELTQGRSVDFVTKAGAGGQVVSLFESARERAHGGTLPPTKIEEGDVAKDIAEIEAKYAKAEKELAEANARATQAEKGRARLSEQIVMRDARDLVVAALAKTDLPPITHKRLIEAILADVPLSEADYAACVQGKVDAGSSEADAKDACKPQANAAKIDLPALAKRIESHVKEEREYVATIQGKGTIRNVGESATTPKADEASATLAESLSVFGVKPEVAKRVAALGGN